MNGSCQIKVDFESDLAAPTGGMCLEDSFSVTGSITVKSLTLCGSITQPCNRFCYTLNYKNDIKLDDFSVLVVRKL